MPTVEATVRTPDAVRYVTQLGRHAAAMTDARGHRVRTHDGSNPVGDGRVALQVEQEADRITLAFTPWGTCVVAAEGEHLVLRVEAPDEQSAQRLQDILTRDIERFGQREHLTLAWRHIGQPAPATGHRRAWGFTVAAVLGVALVLVLHLGLGAAMVAGWGLLGWTLVGGVTLAGVALLLGHLAVPVLAVRVRHRLVRRRGNR